MGFRTQLLISNVILLERVISTSIYTVEDVINSYNKLLFILSLKKCLNGQVDMTTLIRIKRRTCGYSVRHLCEPEEN